MMVMGDGPPKERGRHRSKVENDMISKREREFKHQQMWGGAMDYYTRCDKINRKFDQWTSPRYYEDNNKMISDIRQKRDKEELLAKRRDKLKKLLEEEHKSLEIELMVKKNLEAISKPSKPKDEELELLKNINDGLKAKEEEKRKREAELKLYHQWRINNPIVRQFESKYRFKDLKLSWLDQQIEKKMQKEKEEIECKKLIKQQEEFLKREKEKEEQTKREIEEKRLMLKENLDKQIEDLKEKQKLSDDLKHKESQDVKHKLEIEQVEKAAKEEEKRRLAKECALFNIKQHKLKLKQKALDIQENLNKEKELIMKMKRLQLEELIQDEKKKQEIKEGLREFLALVRDQEDLEKRRQKHLEFIFDSEAKAVYAKQLAIWNSEELSRKKLLNEVLDTVKKQIHENLEKVKEKQKGVLKEREEMTLKVEEFDRDLQTLKQKEEQNKLLRKQMLDEDLKLKNARKKQQENLKLKEIDEELERVRREEEKLHKEILAIQRTQGRVRPHGRTRLFY